MPTFKSFDEISAYLQPRINRALKENVARAVVKVEQRNIELTVYGATDPRVYKRRKYNFGIISEKNIVSVLTEDGTLAVRNVTGPNKTYRKSLPVSADLPALIEYGDGFDDMHYTWRRADGTEWEYRQPRPFTEKTADELDKKGQHILALKQGLKAQGIQYL